MTLRGRLVAAALCAGVATAACTTPPNPYYDASRAHHRPDGFQDNYIAFRPKNFFTDVLLGWQLPSWFKGLPPPPDAAPPVVAPDLAFLRANVAPGAVTQPAATFIGHATVLVQVPTATGGLNVLTDPVFGERASPFSFAGPKRFQPPGVALKDLPHIDVVLISHNHYDHLDEGSVKALAAQPGGPPLFVVPLGIAPWLAERGIAHAVELDWWDSLALPDAGTPKPGQTVQASVQRNGAGVASGTPDAVQLFLVPAQHWSARGLGDRMQTLWGGFALLSPKMHLFYAGDTGYSKDFADIQARLAPRQGEAQGGGFDLALLPVGAYEPRWFMTDQHVNPDESVRIHRDLHAKRSLGVHWATFSLTDEALDQPPRDLAAARKAQGLADDAFFTLAIGETRTLPPRQATP